jgi:hypothetical protein
MGGMESFQSVERLTEPGIFVCNACTELRGKTVPAVSGSLYLFQQLL